MKVKKSSLVLSFLLTSCVGSLTNNIDSKIDAKIDSKVNANASVQTNTNAAVNANVKTGAVNTNIQPPKVRRVKSVSVSPSNFTINVGDEIKLLGSVKYDDESVDNNIAWFSSNGSIAKINSESGVLNVLAEGKVEIIAASRMDASITTTISVTVNSKDAVRVDPIPTFTPIPSPIITATPIQSSIPISTPTPIVTPLPTQGYLKVIKLKNIDNKGLE